MTCIEAIREVFDEAPGALTVKEVRERVYAKHPDRPWKPPTILAHLIGLARNHPSGKHYPSAHKQAFLHWELGGRFRVWTADDEGGESPSENDDTPPLEEVAEFGGASAALSLERDLEQSLLQNLGQLKRGLSLYNPTGVSGQQFNTGEVGRIDLLAVGPDDELVVLELKAGRAEEKVIGQILRYMGWVQKELAMGKPVRGIIVANDFSEALRFAALAVPTVTLMRYEIQFKFMDIA